MLKKEKKKKKALTKMVETLTLARGKGGASIDE